MSSFCPYGTPFEPAELLCLGASSQFRMRIVLCLIRCKQAWEAHTYEIKSPSHHLQAKIPKPQSLILPAMWYSNALVLLSAVAAVSSTLVTNSVARRLEERDTSQIPEGEPIDGNGKGAPILGKSLAEILEEKRAHEEQVEQTTSLTSNSPTISELKARTVASSQI